jgi:hypothetical protein
MPADVGTRRAAVEWATLIAPRADVVQVVELFRRKGIADVGDGGGDGAAGDRDAGRT